MRPIFERYLPRWATFWMPVVIPISKGILVVCVASELVYLFTGTHTGPETLQTLLKYALSYMLLAIY